MKCLGYFLSVARRCAQSPERGGCSRPAGLRDCHRRGLWSSLVGGPRSSG